MTIRDNLINRLEYDFIDLKNAWTVDEVEDAIAELVDDAELLAEWTEEYEKEMNR